MSLPARASAPLRLRSVAHRPNSTYWTEVGEVAAFEELCGSHGGMGGTQGRPFILYPAAWTAPPGEIVGAEYVHRQFVSWLAELGHTAYADLPDVPHRLLATPPDDGEATPQADAKPTDPRPPAAEVDP